MTSEPGDRTAAHPARPATTPVRYAERLRAAPWMWPATTVAAAVVAVELALGLRLPWWPLLAVALVSAVALLLWLGRLRVAVTDTELQVDDARLPLGVVADVVALDGAGKRELLGIGAHPWAFVVQRPWISPAVQVLLDDPADPTPYWVVSTRRPVELATALLTAAGLRNR